MALRLRCGGFPRLLRGVCFDPVFANLKWSSSHPPLFVLVFFLFGAFFLGIGGNATLGLHVCFRALASYFFTGFLCLFTKTQFSPEKKKKVIFHFSVSPFFLLGFFHFSFSLTHSLTLSLSLVSCVFFLVFLFFFIPSLILFCVFSCFVSLLLFHERTTSKYYIRKDYFHQLFLFWGFPVVFFLSNPFSYLFSKLYQLCVLVNIHVFIFQRRPFLKRQALFCTLWKVVVFLGANFWGKFVWCSQNTVKIGISAAKANKYHFEGLFSGPSRGYYLGQVKVWGCRHRSRTSKTIFQILGLSVIWSGSFVTERENAGKTNNRIKSKEHNKDKAGKKRWNTTTAKKKNITTKLRKQGWMTHLQRRRYMKTKREHKETTWKNTPPPRKKREETTKETLVFSQLFGFLFGVPKNLENNFSKKTKTDEWKMDRKLTIRKSENPIFPLFLWKKGRSNKRPGGAFFYRARPTATFLDPLFWGACFKGWVHANDSIL